MSDWKKVPPFELGKNMPAQPAPASAEDSKPLSAREFYRDVYKPDVADIADTFEFAEVYASYCSAADRQRIAELEKGASTPADVPEWRCFGCGFETSDREEALAHFGDLGEEDHPLCVTWHQLDADGRASELQAQIIERNAVERENMSLRTSNEALEYRTHAERETIRAYKPFAKCSTINDVFFLYDIIEGEKLAAVEFAEAAEQEVARLTFEALRWYKADGSYEVLSSPEEVVAKRKEAAGEVARLKQALEQISINGMARMRDIARKALAGE